MGYRAARVALGSALLVVAALTGCSTSPADGTSPNPCEFGAAVFDVGPVEFCKQAVALAQARIGWLHWPITSTHFATSLCPPNARCRFVLDQTEGWVVFTFSIGDPSMVLITTDSNGILNAADQKPVPKWLLDEYRKSNAFPTAPAGGGG